MSESSKTTSPSTTTTTATTSNTLSAINTMTGLNGIIRRADVDTNEINYEYEDGIPHDERFKGFINQGYEHWKKMNSEWRNGNGAATSTTTNHLQLKSIDAMKVTDELINKNGVFTSRVPLADLISILVEEWETEEMMDAH